jgi:hypothetical protein
MGTLQGNPPGRLQTEMTAQSTTFVPRSVNRIGIKTLLTI